MLIPSSLLLPSSGLILIGRADICFFRGTPVTSSRPKSILIKKSGGPWQVFTDPTFSRFLAWGLGYCWKR